jgi:hypothetical protein
MALGFCPLNLVGQSTVGAIWLGAFFFFHALFYELMGHRVFSYFRE